MIVIRIRPIVPGLAVLLLMLMLYPRLLSASTLFALVDTGELFASPDGGASWGVRSTLPVADAAGLVAGTVQTELFLVSGSGTVYRSQDAGNSWGAVGAVAASDVVDVAARADGALVVLTAGGLVWMSPDQGASFTVLASLTAPDLVSLARGGDGVLYTLTRTGTVRRSESGGSDWAVVGTIPAPDAIAIRPVGTRLYILTDPGLVFMSQDAGITWTAVGTVSQVGMRGLVEDQGDLVAVERGGLTARSTDGANWSWVGTVNQVHVVAAANDEPQVVGVPDRPEPGPRIVLGPPSPNPARSGEQVTVRFDLAGAGDVHLALLDARGRRVAGRAAGSFGAGSSEVTWRLPRLASGVYFLALENGTGSLRAARLVIAGR